MYFLQNTTFSVERRESIRPWLGHAGKGAKEGAAGKVFLQRAKPK
jgi:hypothetical protein